MSDDTTPNAVPESTEIDQELVEQDRWVNCWLCEEVFQRRTQTKRFCTRCRRGFCEGWHGNFTLGQGTCVICIVKETAASLDL